jgi:hypothetical protein
MHTEGNPITCKEPFFVLKNIRVPLLIKQNVADIENVKANLDCIKHFNAPIIQYNKYLFNLDRKFGLNNIEFLEAPLFGVGACIKPNMIQLFVDKAPWHIDHLTPAYLYLYVLKGSGVVNVRNEDCTINTLKIVEGDLAVVPVHLEHNLDYIEDILFVSALCVRRWDYNFWNVNIN